MRLLARGTASVTLGALCLALTGCTSLPGGPMLLGSGGDETDTVCSSLAEGASMIVADVIEAPEDTEILIRSVEAVDVTAMDIDGIFLSPLETGSAAIGSSDLPPTNPEASAIWERRVPAGDLVLAPGGRVNVLLVTKRVSDAAGSIGNIRVRYSSGGFDYEKSASTIYEFETICPE